MQEPARLLEHRHLHDLRAEDVSDRFAHGVVDRLRVELARDRLLHAVDQRQLRVPLSRLVHQPRVLERDAQTAGQRLEQLLVRLAEGVLAIDVLQCDQARRLAPGDEGNEEQGLRVRAAGDGRTPVTLSLGVHILGDQ